MNWMSAAVLTFASSALLSAQALQMGTMYECPAVQARLKVYSCAGQAPGDACDVETFPAGRPSMRGKSPLAQVNAMLAICHAQTPAEAQNASRGGTVAAPPAQQTGAGGFKVGDTVRVNTGFGWIEAKVLQVRGNNYYVHVPTGADVWKSYPTEVHRVGPPNAEDHANGIYELGERVQVNVNGQWFESTIHGTVNDEFEVDLPGSRRGYVKAQLVRPSTTPAPTAPKAGTPPKPGFVSCAGKIEGRYSSEQGGNAFSITFRSGKASMQSLLEKPDEYECWVSGTKIILHKAGEFNEMDMPIDINNDGTLDTPIAELKKKGN